jgi:outer membrane protein OmpA-like peptidoglycan-associated protein
VLIITLEAVRKSPGYRCFNEFMRCSKGLMLFLVASMASALALAQDAEGAASGISRQLRLGIEFFDRGEDLQAMDRFMDVLSRGNPEEREKANEYLNLITHRMGTFQIPTSKALMSPKPQAQAPETPAPTVVEPTKTSAATKSESAPKAQAPEVSPEMKIDKEQLQKEIRSAILSMTEESLKKLSSMEGTRILTGPGGETKAIAVASSQIFASGLSFRKEARGWLEALTRLIFSLGGAQVIILPEGTSIAESKVRDMRRTMGISSHLYSAGVSPARIKVNLLNSQVDIPKPLQNFTGIIILFIHNQPLKLSGEGSLIEEGGPALSLGAFPPAFIPDASQGTIAEFSVLDSEAGVSAWKFQILKAEGGGLPEVVQQTSGEGPVYHQVYWNGKEKFFGAPLKAGRYELVLTATDLKNRSSSLRRAIMLLDSSGRIPNKEASLITGGKPSPRVKLAHRKAKKRAIVQKARKLQLAAKKRRARLKKMPPLPEIVKEEVAGESAPKPSTAQAGAGGQYKLEFVPSSQKMTPQAERQLAQIAETSSYYPKETLMVTGFADSSEAGASVLAERLAQLVAGLLINKYQVDPKKIQLSSSIQEGLGAPSVGIRFQRED